MGQSALKKSAHKKAPTGPVTLELRTQPSYELGPIAKSTESHPSGGVSIYSQKAIPCGARAHWHLGFSTLAELIHTSIERYSLSAQNIRDNTLLKGRHSRSWILQGLVFAPFFLAYFVAFYQLNGWLRRMHPYLELKLVLLPWGLFMAGLLQVMLLALPLWHGYLM